MVHNALMLATLIGGLVWWCAAITAQEVPPPEPATEQPADDKEATDKASPRPRWPPASSSWPIVSSSSNSCFCGWPS